MSYSFVPVAWDSPVGSWGLRQQIGDGVVMLLFQSREGRSSAGSQVRGTYRPGGGVGLVFP